MWFFGARSCLQLLRECCLVSLASKAGAIVSTSASPYFTQPINYRKGFVLFAGSMALATMVSLKATGWVSEDMLGEFFTGYVFSVKYCTSFFVFFARKPKAVTFH